MMCPLHFQNFDRSRTMRYICHDNFGSYFVIKLLLLRQKFMLKDITYVHISDFFPAKTGSGAAALHL